MKKAPVAIGYLERFAADFERESGQMAIPEVAAPNGIKIAVIGSGPSGLSFAGDMVKNQENARTYCRFAVEAGCVPIAPHIYFTQFMNDNDRRERDLALFMDIVLLSKCAELWVFGEKITSGMSIEIEKAKRKGQLIRYFTENCEEVHR